MKIFHISILAGIALCLASCSSQKNNLPYFEDISTVKTGTLETLDYLPTILPDDELSITVNSVNPNATSVYQKPFVNPAATSTLGKSTTPQVQTYIVDSEGDISFPVLGKIHVAGMTTEQLQSYLTEKISKDVKDPEVDVRIINFEISVAGEVKTPGRYPLARQRMSILDALAAAGDLTEFGERSNILLVREENGKRVFAHIDLNSSEALNSPYFYLKQNDYIYVSPNEIKQANSKYNQNNAYKLSVISTIVSASSVIASLVIALTVK